MEEVGSRPCFEESRKTGLYPFEITATSYNYINNVAELRSAVSNFVDDIGLPGWGSREASISRNVIYELALNQLQHGSADVPIEISSLGAAIRLRYEGDRFGLRELLGHPNGRGGRAALAALRALYSDQLSLTYRYTRNHSAWTLVNHTADGGVGPCTLDFRHIERRSAMDYLEWVEDCDEVYIRLSQQISFSDTRLVDQVIAGLGGRKVIVRDLPDEPGLRSYILETLSSATFEIEP